jgi:phage-related protein
MPEAELRFYRDDDGSVPVLDWLDKLARKDPRAYLKCREVIGRLARMGHELRRPTADLLGNGIYELRVKVGRVNFRVLYFFFGRDVAILAHGLMKERVIAKTDLARALERKARFEANPEQHTHRES